MPLTQVSSRAIEDTLRYVLGASGTDHYTFTGKGLNGAVNDPALYLTRGHTYIFENRSGGHPFYIKTSIANGGTNDAYNTGVTNNGGGNGTEIIFTVPHDAPDTLYYQCSAHINMAGEFKIAGSVADGSITTQKIADQAVALSKLPHGDSSNDGKFLRANNGADPSYEAIAQPDLTNLSATNLTSGTIPDARLPATLPAIDGSALTNLPAATQTSGTNDFTIADGNLIIGTDGHGIDFSAQTTGGTPYTGSGTNTPNSPVQGEVLDHYETGTWTPTIDYGITAGSTGASGRGDYTRIGAMVIIGFQWTRHGWADFSLSSGDSAIKISGLPFMAKDTGATGVVNIPALNYTGRTSNGQGGATAMVPPSSTYILISGLSGTTPRFHLHIMYSMAV